MESELPNLDSESLFPAARPSQICLPIPSPAKSTYIFFSPGLHQYIMPAPAFIIVRSSSWKFVRATFQKAHKTIMNTKEVQSQVQAAVALHYCATNTAEFLKRLLPVKKRIINTVLQTMKDKGLYDTQSQRWLLFPPSRLRTRKHPFSQNRRSHPNGCTTDEERRFFWR